MRSRFTVPRSPLELRSPKSGVQNLKWLSVRCCLLAVACTLFPVALFGGCGRKTLVKPPELAAPEPVNDLTLEVKDKGVTLHWGRVQKSADGEDLDDLGGFVVLRAVQDVQDKSSEFTQIATIPVEDRDRFRKDKRFSYTDEHLTAGALYRYRVLAFTVDGYYGDASNTVEIVWKGGA